MKIRCKNCYKVLDPNEEYCTFCGEHSEQMAKAMKTGNFGMNTTDKIKTSLLIYLLTAFMGNGICMIALAVFFNDATSSLYNNSTALLISSIVTICLMGFVFHKDFILSIFNGTKKQFIAAIFASALFVCIALLLSQLNSFLSVLPNYMTEYLKSGQAKFLDGKEASIVKLFIPLVFVVITQELISRKFFIDALDENTLFGNTAVVISSAVVGTLLEFLWLMSIETIIVSFLINIFMSLLYIHTNRSILVNIVTRVVLVIGVFIICLL